MYSSLVDGVDGGLGVQKANDRKEERSTCWKGGLDSMELM